jgi:hypothetical protein
MTSTRTFQSHVRRNCKGLDCPTHSGLTGLSEQLAKSYKNPMEDFGKQLASSLALSGMANLKHPLADMLGNTGRDISF